jgi:hypothetical protein
MCEEKHSCLRMRIEIVYVCKSSDVERADVLVLKDHGKRRVGELEFD